MATPESLTTEELTSALRLATLWEMQIVRERTVKALTSKLENDPARQVALAYEFQIDEWLIPALNALARRKEPMGEDNVAVMGIECVLKVARIRERHPHRCETCVKSRYGGYTLLMSERGPGLLPREKVDFTQDIEEVFSLKL
jgi:hypothetical protein